MHRFSCVLDSFDADCTMSMCVTGSVDVLGGLGGPSYWRTSMVMVARPMALRVM
jgi:hypothetical protein